MEAKAQNEYPNWRPPEPMPRTSPRTLAMILLCGGLLFSGFDLWQHMHGDSLIPINPFGYAIVVIWLLRSLNVGCTFAVTGWWISIVWHVVLFVLTLLLLPFALLLARASWLFLLPHLWLVIAFFVSLAGLRAERQLRLAALTSHPIE